MASGEPLESGYKEAIDKLGESLTGRVSIGRFEHTQKTKGPLPMKMPY